MCLHWQNEEIYLHCRDRADKKVNFMKCIYYFQSTMGTTDLTAKFDGQAKDIYIYIYIYNFV
jgi:hypothetical protein